MNFKIYVLCAILAVIFSGCGWIMDDLVGRDPSEPAEWISYVESNGSKEQMGFVALYTAYSQGQSSQGELVGKAFLKKNSVMKFLGHIYSLAPDKSSIIINLDTHKNVVPPNKDDMAELRAAKSFKFYDIGLGIIESIVYASNSDRSVCAAFLANEKVSAKSVTNYYVSNDKKEYFTTDISATLAAKDGVDIKTATFLTPNLRSETDKKDFENVKSSKEKLFESDTRKQGRILFMLCDERAQ
ncbi:hypothetical protein [Campylobacter curvus]|mgnify:FL=1|uniref:DUF8095 domain-containing protein n=1 Tax=Campylobacter curvus (strain 525.92) TaxID=360105 RepID=A0A0M4TLA3_CAMC5|nr:hypothetical protein [Campylobacter curvus]ALF45152.1 hypothetical protein CCV52592_0414 [Campylobacter curvus 525.92]